jgi:hypothetical protein
MSSRISSFPPGFICIGAQKACTSWLNLLLKSDRNKCVFIPYLKETFYLNLLESGNPLYPCTMSEFHSAIYSLFKAITESHVRSCIDRVQTDDFERWQSEYLAYLFNSLSCYWTGLDADWYQHLYTLAMPGQLMCDITPDYSLISSDLIAELASFKPDLKILLITRNPVDRDLSQLRMQLLPRIAVPSEQQCLDFLGQAHVRARSDYGNILRSWSEYFGVSSILTFDASEVASSPLQIVDKINRFLQIDIEVDAEVLSSRDNIGPRNWTPPLSVVDYLQDHYAVKHKAPYSFAW